MIARPTPMTQTTPPLLTAKVAVIILLSTPVHSKTDAGVEYSLLPNKPLITLALASASSERSTWYVIQVGSKSFAKARRFGSRSVITIG
jgi:hypothetical protein